MAKILVIGGSNVDYIGKSTSKFRLKDSNIGELEVSFGGVGRNIAENLSRLKSEVTFITGISSDLYGQAIKEDLLKLNIKVISPITNLPSSCYIAIHSDDGEMQVALCDSRIAEAISESFIKDYLDLLNEQEYILIDANSSNELIDYLFTNIDKKWCIEGVSASKIVKFKNYLDKIYFFKSNLLEARALLEDDKLSIEEAIDRLAKYGIKKIVISNGDKPIYFYENGKIGSFKLKKLEHIVNATGAGDALYAGIIHKLLKGSSLKEACEFGDKLAKITLLDEKAVSSKISDLVD